MEFPTHPREKRERRAKMLGIERAKLPKKFIKENEKVFLVPSALLHRALTSYYPKRTFFFQLKHKKYSFFSFSCTHVSKGI
jgi:hypothetical protein